MNIVWLSWKDRGHPLAGGAEKVSGEIMDRLATDGHNVRLITAQYGQTASHEQSAPNLEIYRAGNRYTVYPKARQLFKQVGDDWADVVIDAWAAVRPMGSSERLAAAQMQSGQTHVLTLRYSDLLAQADGSWRVLFGDRTLGISGLPRCPDEARQWLVFDCTELRNG